MANTRELLLEAVEKAAVEALAADGGAKTIAASVVAELLAYHKDTRMGWLMAYGEVHEVIETDSQDNGYFVFTRDRDPEE